MSSLPPDVPLTLAVEASQTAASVAVLDAQGVRAERVLAPGERSARFLAPAIQALLAGADRRLSDLRLVAVSVGPGSFTSLRVGVTTAKTLAYALGIDVIGIGSLDALAAQAPPAARVDVGIDAGRGQVYAGSFDTSQTGLPRSLAPVAAVDLAEWQAGIAGWVTGPILAKPGLSWPATAHLTEAGAWNLRAATVGALALERHRAGERDDLWQLAPLYVRTSAAEERRAARNRS